MNSLSQINSYFTHQRDIYEPEEKETVFVIVRHGENESNVNKTYDGRTLNLPLTPKGYDQGRIAGQKINKKVSHIDHVITTPMQRTWQTAEKILEAFPSSQPIITEDKGFLERYVGKYEGGPLTELEFTNKKDKEVSASSISFEDKMLFSPEVGEIESYASIWERAHASIKETAAQQLDKKVVLIVTHSGTMRSIYWHLTNQLGFFVPYANFKPGNGAFMVVSVKNGEMTLCETDDIEINL